MNSKNIRKNTRQDYNNEAAPKAGKPFKYKEWYKENSANTQKPVIETTAPIHLTDLLKDFWQAKIFIAGGLICGLACSILFCAIAIPHHRAEIILSPAKPMNSNTLSSATTNNNFSALSFLMQQTGIANTSDFSRFETIARGPTIAKELLQDKTIQHGLREDQSMVFSAQQKNWTPAELSNYLKKRVTLQSTGISALRTMSYSHKNPKFAQYILHKIQNITDKNIRNATHKQTHDRIIYLQKNLQQTNNPEHRKALTTLLLEQERVRMLTSIDQPYAATILEAAFASAKPVWPNKPLVFTALMIVGAFIGFLIHGLRRIP